MLVSESAFIFELQRIKYNDKGTTRIINTIIIIIKLTIYASRYRTTSFEPRLQENYLNNKNIAEIFLDRIIIIIITKITIWTHIKRKKKEKMIYLNNLVVKLSIFFLSFFIYFE